MTRASQKSTSAERWAWLLLLLCVTGIALLGFTSSAAAAVSHTASATNSVNSNSITVSRPAGTAAGDVLIAQIAVGSNKNLSASAGWTLIYDDRSGNQVEQWTYWRTAAGGDPGSWTFSWTGNDRASGAISAYAGADTASPIGNTSTNVGNSTNATATSINAGVGSAVVILPALGRASSFTPPSGASERYDETTGGGTNGVTIAGSDFVVTAAGPTGDQTSVAANSRRWVAHMLEIQANPELTATFPADYSWGDLAIGSTVSSEQLTQVSSNRSWGLKISSDNAAGKMTEFAGLVAGNYRLELVVSDPDGRQLDRQIVGFVVEQGPSPWQQLKNWLAGHVLVILAAALLTLAAIVVGAAVYVRRKLEAYEISSEGGSPDADPADDE